MAQLLRFVTSKSMNKDHQPESVHSLVHCSYCKSWFFILSFYWDPVNRQMSYKVNLFKCIWLMVLDNIEKFCNDINPFYFIINIENTLNFQMMIFMMVNNNLLACTVHLLEWKWLFAEKNCCPLLRKCSCNLWS